MKIASQIIALMLFLSMGAKVHAQCIQGDCVNGIGQYIFKNKSAEYAGAFQLGKPHGQGDCKYANGDQYSGGWSKGLFSGAGTLTQANGNELIGQWKNGKLVQSRVKNKEVVLSNIDELESSSKAKTVWALVVGVSTYEHMPVLRYADDDAWLFYSNLISKSGAAVEEGQVKILIDDNATRKNILDGLEELTQKAGPEDLVLFYFSGHGHEGAFLPIDYDGFNNKLFHSEVNMLLGRTKAKQKICIADACHSGSLFAAKGNAQNAFMQLYSDFAEGDSGTALILSSKSKETSLESKGLRHGVFTYFLVKGLKGAADQNGDKDLLLKELFDYIYTEVREYTGKLQSPLLEGDFDPNFVIRNLD